MMPKYRVWDRYTKKMHEVAELDFVNDEVHYDYTEVIENFLKTRDFKDVELMQSTGLKDVYGKEIYDGDIAEFKYPHDKRFKEIGIITHSAEKACFVIKMIRDTIQEFDLYIGVANSYLKVIGNKFNNPELLEEIE
ncbi:TPA: YopX family protein [Staphylococcus aureus]